MIHLIKEAIKKGASIYANVSGGKDGQAMTRTLINNGFSIAGLLHCDLGRMEWPQSKEMCERQAKEYSLPLYVVTRRDGNDLLAHMERRLVKLEGKDVPFWPSPKERYCTSDTKRSQADNLYRSFSNNLIISAEGIRAEESVARSKKLPLVVRPNITSDYYRKKNDSTTKDGKSLRTYYPIETCLKMYRPDKRLALTWYPIFNMSRQDVWATYGMSDTLLMEARRITSLTNTVPDWWPFHPAYAYGNERVSCMICIPYGSSNDLTVGAKHNPELVDILCGLEKKSGFTFRKNTSLERFKKSVHV